MIDTFKITGAKKKHNYEKVRKMIQFPLYRKKSVTISGSHKVHIFMAFLPRARKNLPRAFFD